MLVFVGGGPATLAGDDWPQWRGPGLNGASPTAKPPLDWSKDKNIRWQAPLPGWAGSTPIVAGGRVFVMSPSEQKPGLAGVIGKTMGPQGRREPGGEEVLLFAFDAASGKPLWQKKVSDGNKLFGKQNMCSPSPVSDGAWVWALSGTGVLAAFTAEGAEQWRVDLQKEYGPIDLYWGYASSPLLHEERIYVQVLHQGKGQPSYVCAFDAKTGKEAWKVERKTDAKYECPDAYTTPVIFNHAGEDHLIVVGANYITAHHMGSGRELWRCGGLNPQEARNYRIVPTPIALDDRIIAFSRKTPILAVRGGGGGDVSATHVLWKYEGQGAPDVPTPACDGKLLFMVDDKGLATCLSVKDGSVVWGPERTAPGTLSASPVLADGRLYLTNENAVTTVLTAGPSFEVLATNSLEDAYTIASLALAGDAIYLRTSNQLYCIAEK